ncbi:hypothetical protein EOM86_03565 [Candidatus Nomurabacteria bacterium]|nr:hypothetical protein [Candidatus Nomurabacteria bacterium]
MDYVQYMKDIKFTPRFEFMEAADVEFARQGTRVCVAGVVIEDDRHKTKSNPRKFSNVKLDSNGMIIQVTCWTEVWSQISELMSEAGTKVMIVTGQVKFSDFYGMNVIETFDRSKVKSELEIINFGGI